MARPMLLGGRCDQCQFDMVSLDQIDVRNAQLVRLPLGIRDVQRTPRCGGNNATDRLDGPNRCHGGGQVHST